MNGKPVIPMVLAAGLIAFSAGSALAGDPGGPRSIVRMSLLTSTEGGVTRTEAFSVSVGHGEGFTGATFGSPEAGSIGTAVGNGGIYFGAPPSDSPYESIVCQVTCEAWVPPAPG